MTISRHPSPIGTLWLVSDGIHLTYCHTTPPLSDNAIYGRNDIIDEAIRQLDEYFAGQRRHFSVPLAPSTTLFRQDIYNTLSNTEYGRTCTYGSLAAAAGHPTASRAVGTAMARNPLLIFIPCHRVIRADGSIGSFAGGVSAKRFLLALESTSPTLF